MRTKFLKIKLKKLILKKIKVITALPYYYSTNKNESKSQVIVNDKNTDYFIEQLIRLAYDIKDIQIFLKFKNLRWLKIEILLKF